MDIMLSSPGLDEPRSGQSYKLLNKQTYSHFGHTTHLIRVLYRSFQISFTDPLMLFT